jgi:bifunctional non-homologous end joining protein LigD
MPTPRKLPTVEPIVPTLRPAPFNNAAWLFEPKYDGFRGLVYLTGGRCSIYSKRQNKFSKFPELEKRLCAELTRLEVVRDAEIIAIDDKCLMHLGARVKGRRYLAATALEAL